jgi:hypothetical protein
MYEFLSSRHTYHSQMKKTWSVVRRRPLARVLAAGVMPPLGPGRAAVVPCRGCRQELAAEVPHRPASGFSRGAPTGRPRRPLVSCPRPSGPRAGRARRGPRSRRQLANLLRCKRRRKVREGIERITKRREETRRNLWPRGKDKGERGRVSVVGFL